MMRTTCQEGASNLRNCGPAPDFAGISGWLNTPDGKPFAGGLKGHVVLLDFWTYSCINCQRTLPHVEAWYKAYQQTGFEVVGVHTPEFAFEHVTSNVPAAADPRREVPDRDRQRLRHLERVQQPVLAGRVPHRRQRQRSGTSSSARATTPAPRT